MMKRMNKYLGNELENLMPLAICRSWIVGDECL